MSALERVSHFVKMWDAKPLKGLAENFYGIHIGTEWEAGLTIDDLRAVTALNAELLEALEAAEAAFESIGYESRTLTPGSDEQDLRKTIRAAIQKAKS